MDKKLKCPSQGGCLRLLRNTGKRPVRKLVLEQFCSAEASVSLAYLDTAQCCGIMVSHSSVGPRECSDRKDISTASYRGLPSALSFLETLAKEDEGNI